MKRISIKAGSVVAMAELLKTRTAEAVWQALPISSQANTWGEEIYFSIPVSLGAENPSETVSAGDLGYWPPGKAFCIFFGPTPASHGNEIRPASPVNVLGKLTADPKVFLKVKEGEKITIERVSEP